MQVIFNGVGKKHGLMNLELALPIFMFTLFPILWMTYSTLSTYLYGSTLGTKFMGYHFEQLQSTNGEISFVKALSRSLILLACVYTWGAIYLVMLFTKQKSKVLTDLVENVIARENHTQYLPVPLQLVPTIHQKIENESTSDEQDKAA